MYEKKQRVKLKLKHLFGMQKLLLNELQVNQNNTKVFLSIDKKNTSPELPPLIWSNYSLV